MLPEYLPRYLHARAMVATAEGAFAEAEREARRAARAVRGASEAWWFLNDLAEACLLNGAPLDALGHFTTGRRLASQVPSITGEIWAGLGQALALYHLDRPTEALATLDGAESLASATGNASALATARLHRARVLLDLGDVESAANLAGHIPEDRCLAPLASYVSSLVAQTRGILEDALRKAQEACEAASATHTPLQMVSGVLLTRDELEVLRETIRSARGDTSKVRERLQPRVDSMPPRARLAAMGLLADCAHREGDDEASEALFRETLASDLGRQEVRTRRLLLQAWSAWSPEAERWRGLIVPPPKRRRPVRGE